MHSSMYSSPSTRHSASVTSSRRRSGRRSTRSPVTAASRCVGLAARCRFPTKGESLAGVDDLRPGVAEANRSGVGSDLLRGLSAPREPRASAPRPRHGQDERRRRMQAIVCGLSLSKGWWAGSAYKGGDRAGRRPPGPCGPRGVAGFAVVLGGRVRRLVRGRRRAWGRRSRSRWRSPCGVSGWCCPRPSTGSSRAGR